MQKYVYWVVILVVVALGIMYYQQITSPKTPSGPTITITEDGASVTENYRIMPKRERYFETPYVKSCHGSNPREYCSTYDKNDGLAYVYDLSLSTMTGPREYTECPGGGHDCWYTEKFDQDGSLIAVTNKQGESLIDKLADDLWSDKIDINHDLFGELAKTVEIKDGKLVTKKAFTSASRGTVNVGDVLVPTDMESDGMSSYFIVLLIAMKLAGMEKPGKIILNVKGARDRFREQISSSHTVQYEVPSEPTPQPQESNFN